MTYKEAKIYIRKQLSSIYPENEITGFIIIIFSELFNVSSVQLITNEEKHLKSDEYQILIDTVRRLTSQEPIQYIIGRTYFFGLIFNVNKHVLIPRPETEELVNLIINENNLLSNLKVLDIGTGSGCIAVSLGKNLRNASIIAIDVSSEALKIAESNSLVNNIHLSLFQGDILKEIPKLNSAKFDLIVSNPPYVTSSETGLMEKNVLDYEPNAALFVNDKKPLIFYEAITDFARKHLNKNGKLYFEINEQFGKDVQFLLVSEGFYDVKIIKDINGKDRIARCNI